MHRAAGAFTIAGGSHGTSAGTNWSSGHSQLDCHTTSAKRSGLSQSVVSERVTVLDNASSS